MSEANTNTHKLSKLLSTGSISEIRRIELKTRRNLNTSLIGQFRSAFRGSGLIFNDVREYMPGDDVKHIHWKITARSGNAYVKSYEEDRELNIILAADVSRSTLAGSQKSKHQKALEFCAIVSILAKLNLDSLGLCLFSNKVEKFIPAARSRTQVMRVLSELAEDRDLHPKTSVAEALNFLSLTLKRKSIIFLISDFHCGHFKDQLQILSLKHDVIAVLLEDELDYSLPHAGLVEFVDAESGESIIIDSSNRKTRETLKKLHEHRVLSLENTCRDVNADFLRLRRYPLRALAELMNKRNQRIR